MKEEQRVKQSELDQEERERQKEQTRASILEQKDAVFGPTPRRLQLQLRSELRGVF